MTTATPSDLHRERTLLARRWPAAVRDVLVFAARVDRFNRRAVALGLLPIADPPAVAVGALWAALLDEETGDPRAGRTPAGTT